MKKMVQILNLERRKRQEGAINGVGGAKETVVSRNSGCVPRG